jgi:hypothetical protein
MPAADLADGSLPWDSGLKGDHPFLARSERDRARDLGLREPLRAEANGSIRITVIDLAATIKSTGGNINIGTVASALHADSRSGDMAVNEEVDIAGARWWCRASYRGLMIRIGSGICARYLLHTKSATSCYYIAVLGATEY